MTRMNAATQKSSLLSLPAEVREIIFRMVVGDKVIHLFKWYCDTVGRESSPDEDEREWELARTLCRSPATNVLIKASTTRSKCQPLASEHHCSRFLSMHQDCTDIRFLPYSDDTLDFGILATCRQIYQEVFPLFWRTNKFCFESETLAAFLHNLSQAQIATLRHVAILHYVNCGLAGNNYWDSLYLDTLEQWTLRQNTICAPTSLSSLEIHLQLYKGNYIIPTTTRFELSVLQVALRAFAGALGEICPQDVDQTSLHISYHKPSDARIGFDERLTEDEISELTATLRDHMSYPTRSGDTLTTDAMANEILRSEKVVDKLRLDADYLSENAAVYKQKAEVYSIETQKLTELKATLSRRLSIEIKDEADWQREGGQGDIEQ